MGIAHCGVFDCNACSHLVRGRCPGCEAGNLILRSEGGQPCSIYTCTESKGVASCGACTSEICPFPHDIEMACPVRAQFEKPRNYCRKLADFYTSRHAPERPAPDSRKISDKTVTRLRWYLQALNGFIDQGITRISSQDIGRKIGVKPGLIRRDLSHFGEFGRPSIGYDAQFLRDRLHSILHLDNSKSVVWVGPRRLEEDPTLIERFAEQNCYVAAIFSTDDAWIGRTVVGMEVSPVSVLAERIKTLDAQGAVIEVRPEEAQSVADILVMSGISAMLNLTSAVLVTPPGIVVRNVDVAAELSALSYYCGEKSRKRDD